MNDSGSWVLRLLEMNRVAAVGRASCVRVVKTAIVAVRRDICPVSARLRILKRRMVVEEGGWVDDTISVLIGWYLGSVL